jgi:predicted tellurium resistance membrane protein TerC
MDFHVVLVILNLIIIESLLSVDNASALAAMVQHLPDGQRQKALRYGLVGAYVFRGACLLAASWLIKNSG